MTPTHFTEWTIKIQLHFSNLTRSHENVHFISFEGHNGKSLTVFGLAVLDFLQKNTQMSALTAASQKISGYSNHSLCNK